MLEVLGNAVAVMKSIDTDGLSDDELHRFVVDISRSIDQLSAIQSQLVSEWTTRGIWSRDGSRSPGHRLSRETGMSISSGKRVVHRAKRLGTMPVTTEAFISGDLSTDRVDLLVRANQANVRDLFIRDEQLLVKAAQDLFFIDAKKTIDYWSQCADEATAESTAHYLVQRRSCSVLRTFEGAIDIQAQLDPIDGTIVSEELRRIEQELFEKDWKLAKEDKSISDEELRTNWEIHSPRTTKQRRADALVEMAKRSAGFGSTNNKRPRPLISVVVGYETFKGRLCQLSDGTAITPNQILPLLQEADIERIVFDGPSRVIDVSEKRSFKGALRRAIQIRDGRCQHPSGCDEPADRCDVDHIKPHSLGGETSQENGQSMCSPHNRGKGDDWLDEAEDEADVRKGEEEDEVEEDDSG